MALSEKEGRLLRAIEATLIADDPVWARQFTEPQPARLAQEQPERRRRRGLRTRHVVWTVLVGAWVALLATGVALGSPALTLTAVAILLWAPLACVVVSSFRS
jgi:Flp pilus assembly protein TadB